MSQDFSIYLNEQGPQGIQGPQGPQGIQGPTGATGNGISSITGPETEGLVDTYTINMTNGDSKEFTVTNGEKGDQGNAGTITVGTVSTGSAGSSVIVTNTGTPQNAILNFTIPKGDKGDKGDTGNTGATGQAATISVNSTTTGEPGTNASVTNSGTSSNAVLNFTIPRGNTGNGVTGTTLAGTSGLVDTYNLNYTNGNHDSFTVTNGYSPTASVTKTGSTTNISITDKDGTTTSTVYDGTLPSEAIKAYLDAGELMTDEKGLADVTSYKYSTFDLSKFTQINGHNTLSITSQGVASGFYGNGPDSNSSYLRITPIIDFNSANSWKIKCSFITGNDVSSFSNIFAFTHDIYYGVQAYIYTDGTFAFGVNDSSNNGLFTRTNFTNNTLSQNTIYYASIEFTGTQYICKLGTDEHNLNTIYTLTSSTKITGGITYQAIGARTDGVTTPNGAFCSIDLKQFSITVDGVPVFNGNKTGSDTYTINGSTVTIPYTLSKTGSKIVDSYYRTEVTAVYNEFGYAPYYTLSDSDFTLPMGEVYGLIERNSADIDKIKNTYIKNESTVSGTIGILSSTVNGTSSIAIGSNSKSTGNYSISLGEYATSSNDMSYNGPISIGCGATASKSGSISIGYGNLVSGTNAVSIGLGAKSTKSGAISIGGYSQATGTNSIQLGVGANDTDKTLYIGFQTDNYKLLNGTTGLIPQSRLPMVNYANGIDIKSYTSSSSTSYICPSSGIISACFSTSITNGSCSLLINGYEVSKVTGNSNGNLYTQQFALVKTGDTVQLDASSSDVVGSTWNMCHFYPLEGEV